MGMHAHVRVHVRVHVCHMLHLAREPFELIEVELPCHRKGGPGEAYKGRPGEACKLTALVSVNAAEGGDVGGEGGVGGVHVTLHASVHLYGGHRVVDVRAPHLERGERREANLLFVRVPATRKGRRGGARCATRKRGRARW